MQSAPRAVYLSFEDLTGCRRTENIPNSEFESVVRYCRIRGCRAYLALNIPVREDPGPDKAAGLALRAQRCGVDAIIVRDLGLFRILRSLLPEMPLFADAHLGFYTPERGHRCNSASGAFSCPRSPARGYPPHGAVLAETAVWVQTPLCAAACGTCRMSAFAGRESAERGLCSELCREQYTLGGRWDHDASGLEGPLHASRVPGSHRRGRRGFLLLAIAGRICLRVHGRVGDRHPRKPAARRAGAGRLERVFLPWGAAKKDLYETARSAGEDPRRDQKAVCRQRRNLLTIHGERATSA